MRSQHYLRARAHLSPKLSKPSWASFGPSLPAAARGSSLLLLGSAESAVLRAASRPRLPDLLRQDENGEADAGLAGRAG